MKNEIVIHRAGLLSSVQDSGRPGLLQYGVSASGAIDKPSYAIANALVGNAPGAAVIEFAVMGGSFSVDRESLIAVTGGACSVTIDGRSLPNWESHRVRPNEIVSIGALKGATWGYLAISGGIDVSPVLGSRSTHLRTAIGGFEGRALIDGDRLPLGQNSDGNPMHMTQVLPRHHRPICVVPGPQDDYFAQETMEMFFSRPFRIGSMRDRMAAILDGPPLIAAAGHDIVSDGTRAGSIQVPSSGRAILLMADCQTTGGYPKIATVASADFPRVAQLPSGASFRWRRISPEQADAMTIAARATLAETIATLAPTRSQRL